MKRATKAALLSALVFPGAGHLYLKRWLTGALLAGIAAYAVYTIASVMLRVTRDIARQIESGAVSADVETLTLLVTQQLSGSEQATNIASTVFIGCWIIGMVGAYLQGRLQDRREEPPAVPRHDIHKE
jgi:hypothetical protein